MSSSTDGAVPEVTVKFREGSAVRTRDNRFVTERSDDLSPLQAVLEKYPGLRIERTFERPEAELAREKSTLEAQTGQPQPDLNLYFRLVLPNGTDVNAVVAELNRLAIVQTAYLAPTAVPPP
ncbi:MAG: hypothetical protein ACRD12_00225 [Acidimicrobiales bacterium]